MFITGASWFKAPKGAASGAEEEPFSIILPCISTWIQPCGKLTIGADPIPFKVKLPWGEFNGHLPGTAEISEEVQLLESYMTQHAFHFACAVAIFSVFKKILLERESTIRQVKQIWHGKLQDNYDLTTEEKNEKEADRMDPNSKAFIAPGNIFRVLAVLHPGIQGYGPWSKMASTAFLGAWLEIFVPYKIMMKTLDEWSINGIKSPLWVLEHFVTFAAMMGALTSISVLFTAKCVSNIEAGAAANFHILSHQGTNPQMTLEELKEFKVELISYEAHLDGVSYKRQTSLKEFFSAPATKDVQHNAAAPATEDVQHNVAAPALEDVQQGIKSKLQDMQQKFKQVFQQKFKLPYPPGWFIIANAYFWCLLSMAVNISTNYLVQTSMILKVATFTGHIEDAALIALPLYFVFELDKKFLENDPELRKLYHLAVLEKTEPRAYKPTWLPSLAMIASGLLQASSSFVMLALLLVRWECGKTGTVIGGDGLARK